MISGSITPIRTSHGVMDGEMGRTSIIRNTIRVLSRAFCMLLSIFLAHPSSSLSNTPGAVASLTFYGNGVQIYGATSPDYGQYSVSLDGGVAQPYKSAPTPRIFRAQQLLYMAAGLPTGMHTLTYINARTNITDIDYAIVSQYNVPQDPNTGPQPAKPSSSASTTTSTTPSGGSGTASPS